MPCSAVDVPWHELHQAEWWKRAESNATGPCLVLLILLLLFVAGGGVLSTVGAPIRSDGLRKNLTEIAFTLHGGEAKAVPGGYMWFVAQGRATLRTHPERASWRQPVFDSLSALRQDAVGR